LTGWFGRPSRRQLALGGAATAVAALSAGVVVRVWRAPADPVEVERFLRLSQRLTGRSLDAEVASRLYMALAALDEGFADRARRLATQVEALGGADVPSLAAALQTQDPPLAAVLRQIVGAWYLGTIGSGASTRVVMHDEALMYDAVRDRVTAPGACGGVPGAWGAPPV
jgi:hypothetical protein